MKCAHRLLSGLLLASLVGFAATAAEKKDMPKEDVVDVPAIGQAYGQKTHLPKIALRLCENLMFPIE